MADIKITKRLGDFTLNEIREIHDSVKHCGKECPFYVTDADEDEIGYHCMKNRPSEYNREIEVKINVVLD